MSVALIVGDGADPHVIAVRDAVVDVGRRVVTLNSESLAAARWRWTADGFEVRTEEDRWELCTRGWLRRLAPAGAHRGVELGSLKAAEASARLALVTALADSGVEWLTDHWSMIRAENKLVLSRVATEIGLRSPRTVVVADPADIPDEFGETVIVKPLGIGDFVLNGVAHAVHTTAMRKSEPLLEGLRAAPFLVQELVDAQAHLRVVTVGDQGWVCRLDADGLPVDWRAAPEAHARWEPFDSRHAERDARRIAIVLGLGYTSQDWILDRSGCAWIVDVNPAGQWLFLPEPIAGAVTSKIASWLLNEPCVR